VFCCSVTFFFLYLCFAHQIPQKPDVARGNKLLSFQKARATDYRLCPRRPDIDGLAQQHPPPREPPSSLLHARRDTTDPAHPAQADTSLGPAHPLTYPPRARFQKGQPDLWPRASDSNERPDSRPPRQVIHLRNVLVARGGRDEPNTRHRGAAAGRRACVGGSVVRTRGGREGIVRTDGRNPGLGVAHISGTDKQAGRQTYTGPQSPSSGLFFPLTLTTNHVRPKQRRYNQPDQNPPTL
jgi:hypothetical protein